MGNLSATEPRPDDEAAHPITLASWCVYPVQLRYKARRKASPSMMTGGCRSLEAAYRSWLTTSGSNPGDRHTHTSWLHTATCRSDN